MGGGVSKHGLLPPEVLSPIPGSTFGEEITICSQGTHITMPWSLNGTMGERTGHKLGTTANGWPASHWETSDNRLGRCWLDLTQKPQSSSTVEKVDDP